jgi:peptide/nickel transport system ATP-binding protein
VNSPLVNIDHLTVLSDHDSIKILNNLSLDIFENETLGLVGLSGCGKSTLAKSIVGLKGLHSGHIRFKSRPLFEKNKEFNSSFRKEIQLVFQDPTACLNPRMSVLSTLLEPLQIHEKQLSKAEKIIKACEMLEQVGLNSQFLSRYPHELSGGQKQRVCIARSLILKPKFLIFDEAVSALDASIQAQILNLLKSLKKDFGFTLLFISHDLSIVHYISDRIAVMSEGQIVEINPPETIFSQAQDPFTKRLIELSRKYLS